MQDTTIIDTLLPLLTDERRDRIDAVVRARNYGLTVVLENLHDDGNLSAILRTCDAMGIQRINVALEDGQSFKSERNISLGAHKWLDIRVWPGTAPCLEDLRKHGYRIVATHLEASVPLEAIDFSQKVAIVFGNEKLGVSDEVVRLCDQRVHLPMTGFVQSLNVSVAAGIALYHAIAARRAARGAEGDLTDAQLDALRARFYRRSVRSADLLLQERAE